MVQKNEHRRLKKKTARKKKQVVNKKQPTVHEGALLDFITHIYNDLEDLKTTLEYLPGCSIHHLEVEVWEALGQVKAIMGDIEALGEE